MEEKSIITIGKLLQLVPTFHSIVAAASADKLALVPTKEAETGRPVLVLCRVVEGDVNAAGLVKFEPLAEMAPGNFNPPTDGELQYLASVGGDVALIGAQGHAVPDREKPDGDVVAKMLAELLGKGKPSPEAEEPMVPRELRRQRTQAVLNMLLKGKKLLPAPDDDRK